MIEEAEKKIANLKDNQLKDGKKQGIGYHNRVFTHFSISFGIAKLRLAKQSDQGCLNVFLGNT